MHHTMPASPTPARLIVYKSQEHLYHEAEAALSAGDAESLMRLLRTHPFLATARTSPDACGMENTLLHAVTSMAEVAWAPNAAQMAQALLDVAADVNACEQRGLGETPLHHAVSVNNVDVAQVLLEAGATVEATGRYDGYLDTPLGYALFYGQDARLPRFEENTPALLIRYGATIKLPFAAALGDIDRMQTIYEKTIPQSVLQQELLFAAQYGQIDAIARRLEMGANLNASVSFFHEHATALHLATLHEHAATVLYLLARGADRSIHDEAYHATPLHWAQHTNQPDLIAVLRQA